MLSKVMSASSVEENNLTINGTSSKKQRFERRNSNTAREPAIFSKDINAPTIPVARPTGNSNWEKFRSVVTDNNSSQKQPQRRPHPGKSKQENFKARRMYTPGFPSSSENGTVQGASVDGKVASENKELTKHIAMDCEMVGIGDGTESMIARVSLVNSHGACVYDKYVKPTELVRDYRTAVSGIRPHHLSDAEDFKVVQAEVAEILRGRVLVGHALKNDLDVLFLSHPRRNLRDTSRYKPFKSVTMGKTPSLKKLAVGLLGIEIQTGEHSSIEDARTAMQLYMLYKNQWEAEFYSRRS